MADDLGGAAVPGAAPPDVDPADAAALPTPDAGEALGVVVLTAVATALLCWAAHASAVALLVGVAALQALAAVAWTLVARLPGRRGGLLIAGLAAAGADVAVSVWPQGRLGTELAVCALAVPAMFVHQLARGAARVRIVESLAGVAVLVLLEASLPALLQLRHGFGPQGSDVALATVLAVGAALVVARLVDLVLPVPRFDRLVPRGALALLGAAVAGAASGHLVLSGTTRFAGGRGAFVGGVVGVVAALLAVAAVFAAVGAAGDAGDAAVIGGDAVADRDAVDPDDLDDLDDGELDDEQRVLRRSARQARRWRPALELVVPVALAGPVALLLCLALAA